MSIGRGIADVFSAPPVLTKRALFHHVEDSEQGEQADDGDDQQGGSSSPVINSGEALEQDMEQEEVVVSDYDSKLPNIVFFGENGQRMWDRANLNYFFVHLPGHNMSTVMLRVSSKVKECTLNMVQEKMLQTFS